MAEAEEPAAGSRTPRPQVMDAALAEFNALRAEIGSRSTFAHMLININAVASGVLAGLVVQNTERVELLLILPILSPVLGLLWIDHAYNIGNLGDYINVTLRPLVREAAGPDEPRLLSWEEHVDAYEQRTWLRFLPLGVPVAVLFAGVPLASLARTIGDLETTWQWILWVWGALLTLVYLVLWGRLTFHPLVSRRRSRRRGAGG